MWSICPFEGLKGESVNIFTLSKRIFDPKSFSPVKSSHQSAGAANSAQKYQNYIRTNDRKKGNFCTVILLAQYLREILHISWQQNGTFVDFNEDFCWKMSSFKLYNQSKLVLSLLNGKFSHQLLRDRYILHSLKHGLNRNRNLNQVLNATDID